METIQNTWDMVGVVNPFSLPAIIQNDKNEEGMGNAGTGVASYLFFQLISCIISLYIGYIIIKCYCGNYLHIILANVFLCCSPLCTIPYLFYQHFGNKCGKGQIGKPTASF